MQKGYNKQTIINLLRNPKNLIGSKEEINNIYGNEYKYKLNKLLRIYPYINGAYVLYGNKIEGSTSYLLRIASIKDKRVLDYTPALDIPCFPYSPKEELEKIAAEGRIIYPYFGLDTKGDKLYFTGTLATNSRIRKERKVLDLTSKVRELSTREKENINKKQIYFTDQPVAGVFVNGEIKNAYVGVGEDAETKFKNVFFDGENMYILSITSIWDSTFGKNYVDGKLIVLPVDGKPEKNKTYNLNNTTIIKGFVYGGEASRYRFDKTKLVKRGDSLYLWFLKDTNIFMGRYIDSVLRYKVNLKKENEIEEAYEEWNSIYSGGRTWFTHEELEEKEEENIDNHLEEIVSKQKSKGEIQSIMLSYS